MGWGWPTALIAFTNSAERQEKKQSAKEHRTMAGENVPAVIKPYNHGLKNKERCVLVMAPSDWGGTCNIVETGRFVTWDYL